MCLVFVVCLVQVLGLKFRAFATRENCHRYKLFTSKYLCIFYEEMIYFFLPPVNSGGCGMCSLLSASVKLQKPANVNCNSQFSILAINHGHFVFF